MERNINYKIKLNNGVEIPQLGLGVYLIKPAECIRAVISAFNAGYRLVDTAAIYGNEPEVGKAISQSGIPREEIFVTTKLKNDDHGYDSALRAFELSLKKLNLDYIDLYLIHWPGSEKRKSSWKALEKIYESGSARSIGVSNYMVSHLEELLTYANTIPVINQVEYSPFLNQRDLYAFCEDHKIKIEAYSPLARMKKTGNEVIKKLQMKYSKSYSQIMIRWAIQNDLIVIPKSSDKQRIEENADVFDFQLSDEDMKLMNRLDEGFRVSWNPKRIK